MNNRTVAFVTLGCKLNFAETSTLERQFEAAGYKVVSHNIAADVYVINTCSVTEHADKKCRNIIRRLHKISPSAVIAVTGCYAQLKPEEISRIEGVEFVVGAENKKQLLEKVEECFTSYDVVASEGVPASDKIGIPHKAEIYHCDVGEIKSFFPAFSYGERTRTFLKVQDGCDYYCSYCTVPLARGRSRNIPISSLVDQAREIAADGVKEVVLTGVNTGDFGKSTGESFLDLLKALDAVEGIERYRISSIEPNLLTDDVIDWIAEGHKFLPHFHIPLQSGCDKILAAMRRRYDTGMFERKIEYIRARIKDPNYKPENSEVAHGGTDDDHYDSSDMPHDTGSVVALDSVHGQDNHEVAHGGTDDAHCDSNFKTEYAPFDDYVFFGIDVIVGFPGETDEDFECTYRFLERIRPAFIHIFPYSRRANTPAAQMPQVQDSVKTIRVSRLEELCDRLHSDFYKSKIGRKEEVLFESKIKGGMMTGYTRNYIKVERPYDHSSIGQIVEVVLP